MSLSREEYRALEDVIGPEYISQDQAIRETYNQTWGNMYLFDGKWSIRPGAIVLPGSTEDVQAIVKVCNRYGIFFKPIASGWEHVCLAVTGEHSVILDMRRMNRILEIDPKNMYAVVEPYVQTHQLQLEAAKYGLRIGQLSAGPSAVVVQLACCHLGESPTMHSTGGMGRQTLGVEWVLPTGDILRMGSAEFGNGWFSAEGPGLDLRGIQRGRVGTNGGNGIFTKVSVKMYPWYGPPEWELVGSPPAVKEFKKTLEGYKILLVTFKDAEGAAEAAREISTAEIAVTAGGGGGTGKSGTFGETARDEWETLTKIFASEEYKIRAMSMQIVIGADSNREMTYREKCALEICRKYGGELNPELSKPDRTAPAFSDTFFTLGPKLRGYEHFAWPRGISEAPNYAMKISKIYNEYLAPYTKKALQIGFSMIPPPVPSIRARAGAEYNTVGGGAMFTFNVDPYNPESLKSMREVSDEALTPNGKLQGTGMPMMWGAFNWEPHDHMHENFGPLFDNYDVWMRGIKRALDPNNVNDWGAYIPPEYVKIEKGKEKLGERINNPDEW